MDELLKKKCVIIPVDEPSPVAYLNVYEEGDIWVKIKGCEGCKNIKKCCGNCPLLTPNGCFLHLQGKNMKPYNCIVNPTLDMAHGWCQLEFKCVKGSNKGKIRRIRDEKGKLI